MNHVLLSLSHYEESKPKASLVSRESAAPVQTLQEAVLPVLETKAR